MLFCVRDSCVLASAEFWLFFFFSLLAPPLFKTTSVWIFFFVKYIGLGCLSLPALMT